ncbi:MAG: flagellar biosynthesis protein FlhA [Proteobacteria bacterium]|nr:flagellar biosynthesis protein FlhA [Pseudomonadota bacterium]
MNASGASEAFSGSRVYTLVPLALVGVVLLLVTPVPSWLLDVLLATSIALSVALLLIAINLERPLEISAFPTILLFTTLLRLALNVASTRLILLDGGQGTRAAGGIIEAFGVFMVGGNFVVGAAIFLLLVIINFIVITKGSGRVAEVAARFALDGLPGKQMSIDADLSAGMLTQDEARARRKQLEQESDFFGAMDGASKFVRGDAVAGLLMTGINVVVGFIVGVLQQDMELLEAASTYTILSVGDGLASQIPALLVSTAAGVVVTRTSTDAALSPAIMQQLGLRKRALLSTAGLLAFIGLLPGMPLLPFGLLAGAVWALSRHALDSQAGVPRDGETGGQPEPERNEREELEELLPLDLLELEVGYDLVPLVDGQQGGELVERIAAIRRNLASELGILIPSIHIRDNVRLGSRCYRLLLSGNTVGEGELRPRRLLAMDPTGSAPPVDGETVKEPAFGLPARWIATAQRERAEGSGYTVVDAATVAATHITEMLRGCASDLLGRSEAQELIDILARREPRIVDELIPNLLPLGEVIKVLRGLLQEGVSIRDLRSIFEALADNARECKDTTLLTDRVRQRLARHITARFKDEEGRVAAVVLEPRAEDAFRQHGPSASEAQSLLGSLDGASRAFAGVPTPPVLVCSPDIRPQAAEFFRRRVPGLSVLSYREIDPRVNVRTLGVVTI